MGWKIIVYNKRTLFSSSGSLSCKLILEFAGWCNIWYLGRIPTGVFLDWMWGYILLSSVEGIWQGSFITIFSKQSTGITKQGGWNNACGSSVEIICIIVGLRRTSQVLVTDMYCFIFRSKRTLTACSSFCCSWDYFLCHLTGSWTCRHQFWKYLLRSSFFQF